MLYFRTLFLPGFLNIFPTHNNNIPNNKANNLKNKNNYNNVKSHLYPKANTFGLTNCLTTPIRTTKERHQKT